MTETSERHVQNLYKDLTNAIGQGIEPDAARRQVAALQEQLFGGYPDLLAERLAALSGAFDLYQEQLNRVQYLQKKALNFGREQWYLGPAEEGSLWSRLESRLQEQRRSSEEIELVGTDSTTVVGLLDNPAKDRFSTKGLVVGHVQSGKTGNMAAVITKAADTQYKFFLVLSGLTDQLRNQTQSRLNTDVIGLAPERWMPWTSEMTSQVNGDFAHAAVGGFSFDHRNQIAVVKKNPAVLRRFLAKLRNTDAATLRQTPFLIIDDECDQASVNSAKLAAAVTRINELIRQIIGMLPRVAYVGYTATPFANVLIDTTVPEDLYPRHFIHALKRPSAYFGAEELFGRHALNGEYDEGIDGLDMIRDIPDDDAAKLRPPARSQTPVAMPASLQAAIRYFTMVVAARKVRGQGERHNSMLVHTSMLNSMHREIERVVRPYVAELVRGFQKSDPGLLDTCRQEWGEEQARVLSEQFDRSPVSFEELRKQLADSAGSIQVHVENWTASERLDYSGGTRTYLVIGGNVLARGLTLEGLSVSYFLRSSSQYDTLMQMGRWFGYRPGFEDLPRVWVEERVRDAFFDLATVEAEIRQDIRRFAEEQVTPEQFAVRVRKIPGMAITAKAKMRSAVAVKIGYAGTHVQTFRFMHKDEQQLQANWRAGAALLAGQSRRPGAGALVYPEVPVERILKFLRAYSPHHSHKSLSSELLSDYIDQNSPRNARLGAWSVVVVTGNGAPSRWDIGGSTVRTVIRSAESSDDHEASIKALMTRHDILLDLPERPQVSADASWDELKEIREAAECNALLLLYPIEAKSEPRRTARGQPSGRKLLDAAADVLGYGIVFPGGDELSGTYVAANITPDDTEPADDLGTDDELPAELIDGSQAAL